MRIQADDILRTKNFIAVDNTDFVSRETSLTNVVVYYSLDGGAATIMTTPTVAAIDATNMPGVFKLAIDEAGMVTLGASVVSAELVIHITADEMAPVTISIVVVGVVEANTTVAPHNLFIKKGTTSNIITGRLFDATTGEPYLNATIANLEMKIYTNDTSEISQLQDWTALTALAMITTAWTENYAIELDSGVYRFDIPDGSVDVATQAAEILIRETSGLIKEARITIQTDPVPADSNGVILTDNAITAAKFDESTAFPIKSADTGATQIARTGADGDTLETLSDEVAALPAAAEGPQIND